VRVDVILAAELPMPHAYVFRPERGNRLLNLLAVVRGRQPLRSPCLAYVVRHPTAGTILVDTGLHPDVASDLRKDFGTRMALFFRSIKPADSSYDEQLHNLAVEPTEVRQVVMTHLHVDHTSGMRLLPNARFLCTGAEWTAANTRHAATRGYVAHHLPPESRIELVDFDANGRRHGPFASTIDLLGDGTVLLISTPGHTTGHLSVLLRVAGGRKVLVVGDAAYTLRSIREQILPLLSVSDEQYLTSLRELKAFSESEPEAILVPTHDPTAWHALRDLTPSAEKALAEIGGPDPRSARDAYGT
jgi:glyoxylase-like metal-dependent hydrolase (beta-lactamase superfamily II)